MKTTAIAWTELGMAVKEIGRSVIGIHTDVSSVGNVNLPSTQTKVKSILDFTCLYGFINILNHTGGKEDLAAISSKRQLELADILPILETGQMLNFVQVKSGDVSITEKGYLVLAAGPRQQKIILKPTIIRKE